MKEMLKVMFACVAIILGIVGIIKIVGNEELIMISMIFTFGVLAIIWTVMAHSSLSPGSSLRSYTGYFLACLIFVLLYTLWNSAVKIFTISGSWNYLGYLFIALAYFVFVSAARKIYYLGKEFGFKNEAQKIKKIISEKSK